MDKYEYFVDLCAIIAIDNKVDLDVLASILELNDKFYKTGLYKHEDLGPL